MAVIPDEKDKRSGRMKRKVKAWVAVDDEGKPKFTSVYGGFYAVLDVYVDDRTIPCTITYELPETPKRKARR